MLKSRLVAVTFVAALLSLFGATAANAAYAPQAYTVNVNPGSVHPGDSFDVTFTSTNDCQWTLDTFQGQDAPAGSGKTYTVTLTAPDNTGNYDVTAECTWDPESTPQAVSPASHSNQVTPAVYVTNASSDTLLADPQTDPVTGIVRVRNGDDDDNGSGSGSGGLPNTGGSNESILMLGAGLLVAGAGVTIAARRRKTA